MDESVKQKWVAALRSGAYEQGIGVLRSSRNDGFCCLGVLCDLYNKENVAGGWLKDEAGAWYFTDAKDDHSNTMLPRDVIGWADLDEDNPDIDGDTLAEANDRGTSFNAIADNIETYL
jgi:hypothetical protein